MGPGSRVRESGQPRGVAPTGSIMTFNPDKHHRRSIRLKGYDYSQSGAYFVTICVQNRECLYGNIINGKMLLNDAGEMVHRAWNDLPAKYPGFEADAFVVMPNHVHGIIVLVGAGPRACTPPLSGPRNITRIGQQRKTGQPQEPGQPRESGQPRGVCPYGDGITGCGASIQIIYDGGISSWSPSA